MLLLLGGTVESREVAEALNAANYSLCLSVFSQVGRQELPEAPGYMVRQGGLDLAGFTEFIADNQVTAIVDAAHPFAKELHEVARRACQQAGISYIRFARKEQAAQAAPGLYPVADYPAAVKQAFALPGTVFLTIGSRQARPFIQEGQRLQRRVVARILPDPASLEECLGAGLGIGDIIAAKGPFSKDFNLAVFREYGAGVVVSKAAGQGSGQEEKLQAAGELGLPVVLIARPAEDPAAVETVAELLALLQSQGLG